MTRDELIAALEAAEGPSRELDADIAYEVGYLTDGDRLLHSGSGLSHREYGLLHAPHYTSSIDAALTLVPKGHMWGVGSFKTVGPYAALCFPGDTDDQHEVRGATPAIALCIAALKARAA